MLVAVARELFPRIILSAAVLVLHLHGENRSAVGVEKALDFLVKPLKVPRDVVKILWVVATRLEIGVLYPIGETAVAHLAVHPRTYPEAHLHFRRRNLADELAQAFVARKIEYAFLFLVVNPDDVGSDGVYAQRFHFRDFLVPASPVAARVLILARHRPATAFRPRKGLARRRLSPCYSTSFMQHSDVSSLHSYKVIAAPPFNTFAT